MTSIMHTHTVQLISTVGVTPSKHPYSNEHGFMHTLQHTLLINGYGATFDYRH